MPKPLSRQAPAIKIYWDGNVRGDTSLLYVRRSLGGRMIDVATFEVYRNLLSDRNTVLKSRELYSLFKNAIIEITVQTQGGLERVIHYGRVVGLSPQMNPGGEAIIVESRFDPHLFGDIVDTVYGSSRNLTDKPDVAITSYRQARYDGDTVFNPIIDGVAQPNRTIQRINPRYFSMLDPGAVEPRQLEISRTVSMLSGTQVAGPTGPSRFWTLPDIVEYLCETLNPAQTHVRNPNRGELYSTLPTDPALVRNMMIPVGAYLPEALDMVLVPYGYRWRVWLARGSRQIEVFTRGTYKPRTLKLQPFGANLDTSQSNVPQFDMKFDIAERSANRIDVVGNFVEIEINMVLRPAWDSSWDAVSDVNQFNKGSTGWDTDSSRQLAWRKFVANEAGDYTGTRPFFNSASDFSQLFAAAAGENPNGHSVAILRRRIVHPTITTGDDGTSIGQHQGTDVRYYNADMGQWFPIRSTVSEQPGLANGEGVQILENEIGVLFTADDIPRDLYEYGQKYGMNNVKLQITGTVRLDIRARKVRRATASFLVDQRREMIDKGSDYQVRLRDNSPYRTLVSTSTEVDSRTQMDTLAETLLDNHNSATLEGGVILDGIDFDIANDVGTIITGFQGRALTLKTTPTGIASPRYPMISVIEWDVEQQKTRLLLESVE